MGCTVYSRALHLWRKEDDWVAHNAEHLYLLINKRHGLRGETLNPMLVPVQPASHMVWVNDAKSLDEQKPILCFRYICCTNCRCHRLVKLKGGDGTRFFWGDCCPDRNEWPRNVTDVQSCDAKRMKRNSMSRATFLGRPLSIFS